MHKLAQLRQSVSAVVLNPRGVGIGLTTAMIAAGSMASAQEQPIGVAGMQFGAWIQAVQNTAITVINQAGPALFALMAIIGGVYFVWNRVRSLW